MAGVGLPGWYSGYRDCGDGSGSAKDSSEYIELSYVGICTEFSEMFIDGLEENSISWL